MTMERRERRHRKVKWYVMRTCLLSNERLESYNTIYVYTNVGYDEISDELVKHMISRGVRLTVDYYDYETNSLFIDFTK